LSAFLIGFKRFLFNVLLFLGSLPEEYEPEKVVRLAREKKGRFRPTGAEHEPIGRQLPGHWRAGHWRRQAFGEGSLQRKLIWIQPYKTAGPDALAEFRSIETRGDRRWRLSGDPAAVRAHGPSRSSCGWQMEEVLQGLREESQAATQGIELRVRPKNQWRTRRYVDGTKAVGN
jgi:hypothetical protein